MAKRIGIYCQIPGDCWVESGINCVWNAEIVVVWDKTKEANAVFKDEFGEYQATYYPNMGWVWG